MSSFNWPPEGGGDFSTLSGDVSSTDLGVVTVLSAGSGTGAFNAGAVSASSLILKGSTSGNLTLTVPSVVTTYTLTLPSSQGAVDTYLKNDGSGGLSWAAGSGGGGGVTSIGTIDSQPKVADGLVIVGTTLFAQTADSTNPGLVSTGTQSFSGAKTFTGAITASNLSGTNTGDQTITLTGDVTGTGTGSFAATISNLAVTNAKIANSTINLTTKVTGILPVTNGGTNSSTSLNNNRVMQSSGGAIVEASAITASRVLVSDVNGIPVASTVTTTTNAFNDATSSIQTQLNAKQASGNYITALTGDVTASGPGSAASTLATVNSNVGSFTRASVTVNAKGLVTAASSGPAINLTSDVTGTLPIANGGTGQTTAGAAFNALSPMSAGGDLIYGGASGAGTRLANGSAGQLLQSNGTTIAPSWVNAPATPTVPLITVLTSTGTATGYLFTVSSANATAGATYTNNGHTFTVLSTIVTGTKLYTSGTLPPLSGTLVKNSGTGDATITFSSSDTMGTYTPTGTPLYAHVRMIAGGGGGAAGSGTSGLVGRTSILNLTNGPPLLVCNGGSGGTNGNTRAAGGTASLNGATGIALTGGSGGSSDTAINYGAMGGNGPFGGGGGCARTSGDPGAANTGGGGGGADNGSSAGGGGGGGAGGYIEAWINNPSGTYNYAVGSGGSGGGAAGGSGVIIIEEHYQ